MNDGTITCGAPRPFARGFLAALALAGLAGGAPVLAGTDVVEPSRASSRTGSPMLVPFYAESRLAVKFPFLQPPMRLAKEHPSARNPPLLPAKAEKKTEASSASADQPGAEPTPSVVNAAMSVNFSNPISEAIDFFRSVVRQPDAAAVAEGMAFDPEFRPALPPPEPMSQATYQVE